VIERSRIGRTALGAALVMLSLATGARAQSAEGPVVRLSLEGVVDPFVADYLTREIRGAEDAAAILLVIDTPGGLDSSMREIIKAIKGSARPVPGRSSSWRATSRRWRRPPTWGRRPPSGSAG
jgi:membrane-bound ClpP family serine protease